MYVLNLIYLSALQIWTPAQIKKKTTKALCTDRGPAGPCCSPAGRAADAAPHRTPAHWALTSCACSAPQGSCDRGCRLPPPLGSGSSLRRAGNNCDYWQSVTVNIQLIREQIMTWNSTALLCRRKRNAQHRTILPAYDLITNLIFFIHIHLQVSHDCKKFRLKHSRITFTRRLQTTARENL